MDDFDYDFPADMTLAMDFAHELEHEHGWLPWESEEFLLAVGDETRGRSEWLQLAKAWTANPDVGAPAPSA